MQPPKPLALKPPKAKKPPECKVKIGMEVHIPGSVFPDDDPPSCGYWVGKTVKTKKGGKGDIGIRIEGERVFTWAIDGVAGWLA